MVHLELRFDSRGSEIGLSETIFQMDEKSRALRCVRSTTGLSGAGTFQWTAAVKSLCLLFLNFAATEDVDSPALEGESGSAAASLDYAISKEPSWIAEMFGVQSTGRPVLSSLIRRVNPNRKRPGPVRHFLSPRFSGPRRVMIFLDGKEQLGEALGKLIHELECQLSGEKQLGRGRPSLIRSASSSEENVLPFSAMERIKRAISIYPALAKAIQERESTSDESNFLLPRLQGKLQQWLEREIYQELRESENFSHASHQESLRRLTSFSEFERLCGKEALSVLNMNSLCNAEFLGLPDAKNSRQARKALKVRLTTESVGSLALFTYLSEIRGQNITLDFPFRNTSELMSAMRNGDEELTGDICSLNFVSAGNYLGQGNSRKRDYVPLLFAPKGRLSILLNSDKRTAKSPVFSNDAFTSESIIGAFLRSKSGKTRSIAKSVSSSFPTLTAAPQAGVGIVSWFPYTQLIAEMYSETREFSNVPIDNILFCHRSLAEDPRRLRELHVWLRHAWLSLLESAHLRQLTTALLVTNLRYTTLLRRRAELHTAPEEKLQAFL